MDQTLYNSVSQAQSQEYLRHMQSPEWRAIRKRRLIIDKHKCRTCCSPYQLQVHHRTYRNFGNEDMDDLITLCELCHDAITSVIRHRRYMAQKIELEGGNGYKPEVPTFQSSEVDFSLTEHKSDYIKPVVKLNYEE